ncbi:MAG: hypothetical protein Q9191_007227 [Dirinaria sp. TL-2023a]
MALDAATAREMMNKLAEDRAQYLETLNRAHNALAQALLAAGSDKPSPQFSFQSTRRNTAETFDTKTTVDRLEVDSSQQHSISFEDESESDDDESLFVQQTLPPETYTEEGLHRHILEYDWTDGDREILGDVVDDRKTLKRPFFPQTPASATDKLHHSIFDVGNDGAPLEIISAADTGSRSKAQTIWNNISKLNADPEKERRAVGRITIVREPSPILFAALHYTMHKHFDVDEMFQLLVDMHTRGLPHRPYDKDPRHRNTFVWTFEYFTIVGDECRPMKWQKADEQLDETEEHIPVSRCASVIALQLVGDPIDKVNRRVRRRAKKEEGQIYDPFSPWRVLAIQCYPDWKSSIDSHDSTKHYVNGPEAFLVTLRAEYKDARKRLEEVYKRVSDLVRMPPDFMFKRAVRNRLLFEDDEFTNSQRYFWAHQTLGVMNEDIQEMIAAYRHCFKERVWNGTDKIVWPGDENSSSRFANWRKRMRRLRQDIEYELHQLEKIIHLNEVKMTEIKNLRDDLFSGTSVLESRRSVMQATITVQQGHNIKLLTLVTIFFLPLTFVTSVFGMTNMPTNDSFHPFAIVTVIICVPTYMLIGSLNTTTGLQFWTTKTRSFFHNVGKWLANFLALFHYRPKWARKYHEIKPEPVGVDKPRKPRSKSAAEGMAARGGFSSPSPGGPNSVLLSSHSTLEHPPRLFVPTKTSTNSTVKFDLPYDPRPFNEPPVPEKDNSSSGSGAELNTKNGRNAGGDNGWLSRVLCRRARNTLDEEKVS